MPKAEMREKLIVLLLGAALSWAAFMVNNLTSSTVQGAITRAEIANLSKLVESCTTQQAETARTLQGVGKVLESIQRTDDRQDAELRDVRGKASGAKS